MLRGHLTKRAAVVLGTATLVTIAAAGGGYAAGLITGADIADGTLTSADLKDGTVASTDIKNGTVSTGDVKDGSLGVRDLSSGAVKDLAPRLVYSEGAPVTIEPGGSYSDVLSITVPKGEWLVSVDAAVDGAAYFEGGGAFASIECVLQPWSLGQPRYYSSLSADDPYKAFSAQGVAGADGAGRTITLACSSVKAPLTVTHATLSAIEVGKTTLSFAP